jgi:hypothetical protein
MPATYPGISFDEKGLCNYCRQYRKSPPAGEQAFLEVIGARRGKQSDCVVGISGGKDSCYVTYLAKKKYHLRVLAVCYDFPFLCDLARQNIRNVCDTLGVELRIIKTKNDLEYRYVRNHMLSVLATGTSWGQCLFCHYGIDAILYNVAKSEGIPLVLGGITKYELWNPGSRMEFLLNRVKKMPLSNQARFVHRQSRAYACLVEQRRQFSIPGNSTLDVYRRAKLPSNGPQHINVFEYLPWNQTLIEKTLMEETGWIKPERSITWRYDCSLEPFLDYTYKKEFGISTVGIYLSHMIRDGLISREEALHVLEKSEDETILREQLDSVFDFLRIAQPLRQHFFEKI